MNETELGDKADRTKNSEREMWTRTLQFW